MKKVLLRPDCPPWKASCKCLKVSTPGLNGDTELGTEILPRGSEWLCDQWVPKAPIGVALHHMRRDTFSRDLEKAVSGVIMCRLSKVQRHAVGKSPVLWYRVQKPLPFHTPPYASWSPDVDYRQW